MEPKQKKRNKFELSLVVAIIYYYYDIMFNSYYYDSNSSVLVGHDAWIKTVVAARFIFKNGTQISWLMKTRKVFWEKSSIYFSGYRIICTNGACISESIFIVVSSRFLSCGILYCFLSSYFQKTCMFYLYFSFIGNMLKHFNSSNSVLSR